MPKQKFNLNKITQHYFNVLRALKEGKITTEQLQSTMETDVQNLTILLNKAEITKEDYEAYLIVVNEFEDLFEVILNTDRETDKPIMIVSNSEPTTLDNNGNWIDDDDTDYQDERIEKN